MLYYFFDYLERAFSFPGASVFHYLSFRAGMAALFSLVITVVLAPMVIRWLRRNQLLDSVRDLGFTGQGLKAQTPSMGGILIIAGIIIPSVLFARLDNIYIICLLLTVVWLGMVGFVDDYIKIRMGNKQGLRAGFKIIGQVVLGLAIAGLFLYHPAVSIREFDAQGGFVDIHALRTTIPFIKNNELDYANLFAFLGDSAYVLGYVFVVVLIITAVSNGVNLTDGLDGLAAGSSAIVGLVLAIFAYLSGNAIFADYLDVMYIPRLGEVVIFCTAFVGSCIGFLWYNSYPAKIFMGDTGSLAIGGGLAVLSMVVRKELLLPLLCGVFFIEACSVMLQVLFFKATRRLYGVGQRVFLMAPLHHHYQKQGLHEAVIVTRFWIVGVLLGILTLVTLKLR